MSKRKRRSRGSGSLFKRDNGVYYYQYTDPKDSQRKISQSLRTKNLDEAKAKVGEIDKVTDATDKAEVMIHIARQRGLIHSQDLPFSGVWTEFLATSPTAGPGTLALYERALNEFIAWAATEYPTLTSFSQVDQKTAIAYMEHVWRSGVSASTYNDKRNALGLIVKKLANKFEIDPNPWRFTERQKGVKQTRLPLTREQVNALWARLDDPTGLPYPEELRCLVGLCLFAGMRLIDAARLKWSNLDFLAACIRYTPEKTARTSGVEAIVPILPPLHRLVVKLPQSGEYVLAKVGAHYDRNPEYIKDRLIALIHEVTGAGKQQAKAQCQRARSQYGVHSLRHTFATDAARAGVPAFYLSQMTGDTGQTLQRYYVKLGTPQSLISGFEHLRRLIGDPASAAPKALPALAGDADRLARIRARLAQETRQDALVRDLRAILEG